MHYIIYKTTNLVNRKYYIGQHTTDVLDDGYLGSGVRFRAALKKYGKESFSREILAHAESPEQLNALEAFYVGWEEVNNKNCYNLRTGGDNGEHSMESKNKISNTLKSRPSTSPITEEAKDLLKSMPDFITQSPSVLMFRLRRHSQLNIGKKAIKEFQELFINSLSSKEYSDLKVRALESPGFRQPMSDEHREKIRKNKKGLQASSVTREKMKASQKQFWDDVKTGKVDRVAELTDEIKEALTTMPDFVTSTPSTLAARVRKKYGRASPSKIKKLQELHANSVNIQNEAN